MVAAKFDSASSLPDFVTIKLTNRCNELCPCIASSSASGDDMPLALAFSLIDRLVGEGIKSFCFTGGEIFWRRDNKAEVIIEYAASKGATVDVRSNGSFLDEGRLRFLERHLRRLYLSLDELPAWRLPYSIRCQATNLKVLEVLNSLYSDGSPLLRTVVITVNRQNLSRIDELVETALATGASCCLARWQAAGRAADAALSSIFGIDTETYHHAVELINLSFSEAVGDTIEIRDHGPADNELIFWGNILENGDVFSFRKQAVVGNALTHSVADWYEGIRR